MFVYMCAIFFKCVGYVSSELWTRKNSPVKLDFVHELHNVMHYYVELV